MVVVVEVVLKVVVVAVLNTLLFCSGTQVTFEKCARQSATLTQDWRVTVKIEGKKTGIVCLHVCLVCIYHFCMYGKCLKCACACILSCICIVVVGSLKIV